MTVLLGALLLLVIPSCQPLVFTSSESPDHKYRCEVYEGRPSFLWGNKFRYYFNVEQRTPYANLDGRHFEYQSDIELQKEDFQFNWSTQHLDVTIVRAGNTVARILGDFDERQQSWSQTRYAE